MIKISGLEHLTASKQMKVLEGLLDVFEGRTRSNQKDVLTTWSTRRRPAKYSTPAGLSYEELGGLSDIECSRVRDSSWMYLTSFITTRIGVELAAVQRKLPDWVVVGFQLYLAMTFHVTLSPRIYKGGQGPPPKTSTPKAIQTTPQNVGYYATHGPNLSKSLCSLYHRVREESIPTYKPYC